MYIIDKYNKEGNTIVKVTKKGKSVSKTMDGNYLSLTLMYKLNQVVEQLKKELDNEK